MKHFFAVILSFFSACGTPNVLKPHTIVCIGDSETHGHGLSLDQAYPAQLEVLAEVPVINAGVDGNTTRQMLARFQTDVVDQYPGKVIILGGENDIYYGYDPSTNDDTQKLDSPTGTKANIQAMVALAYKNGITPFVATLLPHGGVEQIPARQQAMVDLIAWEKENYPVIDFYDAIEDHSHLGYPLPAYTLDMLHPSAEGAKVMAKLAAFVLNGK